MIVWNKPFLMTKHRYIQLLTQQFESEIPQHLQTGFTSIKILIILITLNMHLINAYPNINMMQEVIDGWSAVVIGMDKAYYPKEDSDVQKDMLSQMP